MSINIDNYKRVILNKITNNDFDFSDDEIFILKRESDLRNELYSALSALESFNYDINKIIDQLNIDDAEFISHENIVFSYVKTEVLDGNYDFCLEAASFISEEKVQSLFDELFHFLENEGRDKKIDSISANMLEIILNKGYTWFLDNVDRIRLPLSDNLIELLNKEIAKRDIVPDCFAHLQEELEIDLNKFSLDALFMIFDHKSQQRLLEFEVNEEERENVLPIYEVIYQRVMNGESFNIDNIPYLGVLFDLKPENKSQLIEKLVQKGGVNSQILTSITEIEKYAHLLVDYITPDSNINKISCYSIPELLMQKLIECGHLECASEFELFELYVDKVIAKIENNDPVYQKLHIKNVDGIQKYPELLRALLERNMVNPIRFTSHYANISPTLLQIVLSEIKKGNKVSLTDTFYKYPNFIEEVIFARNIKTLLSSPLNSLKYAEISDEAISILIEELQKSLVDMEIFLNNCSSFIFQNPKLLHFYLTGPEYFIEETINKINHNENLWHLYTDEVYEFIKHYYSLKYSLDINHLDVLEHKFGPLIIQYLDNENIKQLTNLNEEEFSKFIQLFPDVEFKFSDLETLYDSVMQYKFMKENSKIVSIFADIMHNLEDNNLEYLDSLEEIYSVIDEKFFTRFAQFYPNFVDDFRNSPTRFLLFVIEEIKHNSSNSDYYKDMLHFMTNYYIATKREQYREKYDLVGDLSLPYDLDEKDTEKKLLHDTLKNPYDYELILEKLIESGMDELLARRCIAYYLGEKVECSDEELKEVKNNIKNMVRLANGYTKNMMHRKDKIEQLDRQNLIKRKHKVPTEKNDIYQLFVSLNVQALRHLFQEDNIEAYRSLEQIMQKYKIHVLPPCFQDLLESKYIEISGNYNNLSGFLSYYDKIYTTEKARLESQGKDTSNIMLSPVNIFIYSEVYSSVASVYSQILGVSDANIIKANPGPNSATSKTIGNERLNEAIEFTKSNFLRTKVTVPTFTENVNLANGKSMHVVVGNFTHPSNITHGERTGACMRIGGIGESLYNFCLLNENGFHIRFENPETREYISRVSGFRNGNTVFLNELRNSCNSEDYSNADVVEACRIIAEMLIEKSKDSPCPIENVVVHIAYALTSGNYKSTNFNIQGNKSGLPKFYSDISNSGHVLATTSTKGDLVPINFDKSNVPYYLPAREKSCATDNLLQFNEMVNRVTGVKRLLQGVPLDLIEAIALEDTFVYGIANQDWYIYIDRNLEIHEDIIDIDERAREELKSARALIEAMIPKIEKENLYNY